MKEAPLEKQDLFQQKLITKQDCSLCHLGHKVPRFYLTVKMVNDYTLAAYHAHSQMLILTYNFHEREPLGRQQAISGVIKFFELLGIEIEVQEIEEIKDHWFCYFKVAQTEAFTYLEKRL
jgi:hypothetical protein